MRILRVMSDTTPQELVDAIATDAVDGIDSVSVAGQSVKTKSNAERIEALRELQRHEAAKSGKLPIRMSKLISRGL